MFQSILSEWSNWKIAFGIAFTSLPLVMLYVYVYFGTVSTPATLTVITAGVTGVLLATSMSLGSIHYYTGWFNLQAGYLKQIGELAFILCFVYCLQLLVVFPETYLFGFKENFFTADILLGLASMVIFGAMFIANTPLGRKYLEWEQVKSILAWGYIAYALLVFRAIALESAMWAEWFRTLDTLPSTRFVLSLLAFLVLALRASVIFHRKYSTGSK